MKKVTIHAETVEFDQSIVKQKLVVESTNLADVPCEGAALYNSMIDVFSRLDIPRPLEFIAHLIEDLQLNPQSNLEAKLTSAAFEVAEAERVRSAKPPILDMSSLPNHPLSMKEGGLSGPNSV